MALSNNLIGYGQANDKLNRAYPSWMSNGFSYGNSYEGPQTEKTFAAPGVDSYSLLPLHPTPVAAPTFDPAMQGYGGRQAAPGGGAPEGGAPGDAGNEQGNKGDGSFSGFMGDVQGLYGGVKDAMGSAGLGGTGMQVGGMLGGALGPFGALAGAGLGALYDAYSNSGNRGGPVVGGYPSVEPGLATPGQTTGSAGRLDSFGSWGGQPGAAYGDPTTQDGMAQGAALEGLNAEAAANAAGGAALYRGGLVTHNKLTGPDPRGPDDGYAALDIGEGVLTAKAVKHYGKGLVNKLNRLAVSKESLR